MLELLHAVLDPRFALIAQSARPMRVVRVCGCSGPPTRSNTGSSSANRSRAAAGSPASPVHRARLPRAVRVFRAKEPLEHRQQLSKQVPGGGRVARLRGPVGEVAAGAQSVRVFRAEDSLEHRQQLGVLVPGGGRVARLCGPVGLTTENLRLSVIG